MATAEDPLLNRLEAMLPSLDARVGCEPVLDEVQGAPGLEDAAQLAQRRVDVRDRAHRPRREGGIEAVVLEGKAGGVQAGAMHGHIDSRRRLAASFQPTPAGSTAVTSDTAGG